MATKKRKRTSPLSRDSAAADDGNCRPKRLRVSPASPAPCSKPPTLPPTPTAASAAPEPLPTPAFIPATSKSRQLHETPPPVLTTGTSVSHCLPLPIHHPVLSQYFPRLLSLRVYLRHVLSSSHRLSSLRKLDAIDSRADSELLSLLDTTLVGSKRPAANATLDIADATQSSGESRPQSYSQSEIVDLALHTLFYRSNTRPSEAAYPGKPNNILAQGYRGNNNGSYYSFHRHGPLDLDVMNYYPNTHITTLKSRLWGKVLETIGEEPMLDLLLNTSIFLQLNQENDVSKSNYYQLAGPPLSYSMNKTFPSNKPTNAAPANAGGSVRARSACQSLKRPVTEIDSFADAAKKAKATHGSCFPGASNLTEGSHVDVRKHRDLRTPGEVMFVRSRMFYSKPAYNARGEVLFGLRHIHVLNRFPNPTDRNHIIHVSKYVFPRQFGLHSVFTSTVDRKETIQPLKDYTLREHEIAAAHGAKTGAVPKRLRGKVLDLIERMMRLHNKCSYHALIKYYCPVLMCDSSNKAKPASQSFTDCACTAGQVSGFAKAVMSNVVPREFWGSEGNRRIFMGNLDRFVKLRRYETLSLHEVMQGMKLVEFSWLSTPNAGGKKLSETDARKRLQILAEFMYYMFDSLLVPLLRAHFYITESNVHRNRVFYFRHDVWKRLSEPTISRLKGEMLAELKTDQARRVLDGRKLGFSTVRLLPKEKGIRPIMNLRKRGMVVERGRTVLTQSINSVMTPVFNVLSFEKARKPAALGSSLFNIREMYEKLKAFQAHLLITHETLPKLYFAKVDVQSCFDTIPQRELLKVVEAILTEDEYRIHKFAEVKAPAPTGKIAKKFIAKAGCVDEFGRFEGVAKAECSSRKRRGTVWVEDVIQTYKERNDLLELLEEHVKVNIIKIGKKFFRQKSGIPQGSVLSTILCNFFYGDLERNKLPFVSASTGVLLRLIDDFLFITLNRGHAEQFLRVMHAGHPEYGAFVSAEKSLANFKVSVDGRKINQLVGTQEFPYCGNLIHTKTLGIRRDRVRKITSNVDDTLTVEYSRSAGKSLHRKAVSAFKYQAHAMYFDTNFNTLHTVFKNIYHNFTEAAMKFHRSVRALPRHPSPELLVKTVSDVLDLAFVMIKGCQEKCAVTCAQVKWLGARAFGRVLKRKQTGYRGLLQWLDETARHEERRVGNTPMMASVGGWVSPPELDGSGGTTTTSSKSSSQPSSFQLDDGGVCGDMGHFEEIGLDDDDHHDSHQHKQQQQPQQQHTHSREIGIGRRGVGKMRELTQKRPPILTEHHHLGPPPPPPLRCRPPTSSSSSSSSPASAGLASKNAHRSPSPTMLKRVSSAGRKTVEEIENEYDSDDDVPPDTIFYNVPLSPRSARALSAAASPDRDTPGVQLPRPGETTIPSASEKEAKGDRGRGGEEFRGKSWSDAMEQLGDEAKELSEALERHADKEMEQTERRLQMTCEKNKSSSSVGSGSTVVGAAHTIVTSQSAIRRLTTTATSTVPAPLPLPPLQMTNGMIDPLPISKEKEAVLSRTRPSWLPPKSKEEEKRHLKEYKQMMRLSQQADRKRAEKERMDQEYKDRAKVDTHKLWDQHIIPNWNIATRKSETRELWWQGIAPRCRGTAWQLAFGNSLAVSPETFRLALNRAREVENGLKKSPTMYSFKERDLFGAIRRDVGKTFPELKIFQLQETGPLHQSLLEVLMAYSMYRSDVGYVFGTHVVAGLLLLNLSPEESFVSLVNLLNRPLPLAFYTRDDAAMSRVYDLFLKAFNYKLPSLFQHIHMFLNIPPSLYLEAMFVTLFTLHCPIDIASRIWDVYSFEGDSVLVRAAIAVLTVLEPRLYGEADEIVGILGWGAKGYWELGREDAFMALVRQAGRGEPS